MSQVRRDSACKEDVAVGETAAHVARLLDQMQVPLDVDSSNCKVGM